MTTATSGFGARLRRLVKSPGMQVVVGVGMVVSALSELVGPLLGVEEAALHSGHGLLLFGGVHLSKAIVDSWEGLEKVRESLAEVQREAER